MSFALSETQKTDFVASRPMLSQSLSGLVFIYQKKNCCMFSNGSLVVIM